MSMEPCEVVRGRGPIVLGMPHAGTWLPDDVWGRLNDRGRGLADTDWHVDQLYAGLLDDATVVKANFHRYLIDANRDPDGAKLYAGAHSTELVPLTDFEGEAIWEFPPGPEEVAERIEAFHAPYHAALAAELDRLKATHGVAILYDCHSVRSRIPFLFDGVLPELNVGTVDGTSCAPAIEQAVMEICEGAGDYRSTLNGRFKGGWSTRHHGSPDAGVHALQMEIAQATYLAAEAPPWRFDPDRAAPLRRVLAAALRRISDLAPSLGGKP